MSLINRRYSCRNRRWKSAQRESGLQYRRVPLPRGHGSLGPISTLITRNDSADSRQVASGSVWPPPVEAAAASFSSIMIMMTNCCDCRMMNWDLNTTTMFDSFRGDVAAPLLLVPSVGFCCGGTALCPSMEKREESYWTGVGTIERTPPVPRYFITKNNCRISIRRCWYCPLWDSIKTAKTNSPAWCAESDTMAHSKSHRRYSERVPTWGAQPKRFDGRGCRFWKSLVQTDLVRPMQQSYQKQYCSSNYHILATKLLQWDVV